MLTTLLYIVFVLAAIVLMIVILLQEGKGGGLTDALGQSGQQTFGVGAKGINKFTGYVGFLFLACALGLHVSHRVSGNKSVVSEDFGQKVEAPAAGTEAPAGGAAPATGGAPAGGTEAPK